MPKAIITGASRGLGLALARELARRQWELVIDARGADALALAAAGALGPDERHGRPGDVADERHRQALVSATEGAIELLVNNASILGPEPATGSCRLPTRRRCETSTRSICWRRWRSCSSHCRGCRRAHGSSTSPPTRPSSRTRDGAATAHPRPRSSSSSAILAAELPALRVYAVDPGRHAYRAASAGVSRGGHLRSRCARGQRARIAGADRRRAAEWALSLQRAAAEAGGAV